MVKKRVVILVISTVGNRENFSSIITAHPSQLNASVSSGLAGHLACYKGQDRVDSSKKRLCLTSPCSGRMGKENGGYRNLSEQSKQKGTKTAHTD